MLNNWLLNSKIKNFLKSSFYIDFFIKKALHRILTNMVVFSILYLEKFTVENLFKLSYKLLSLSSLYNPNRRKFLLLLTGLMINTFIIIFYYF